VQYSILVVEDHPPAREGIVEALEGAGFHAVEAANGVEALEYLRKGGPAEVILLDLMMPGMDGWTFGRAQQQDKWIADIPVVVLSALEGHPVSGVSAAASFKKPINLAALIETLRTLCAQRSRTRH
jgi:two-component system cell cycle response regulator